MEYALLKLESQTPISMFLIQSVASSAHRWSRKDIARTNRPACDVRLVTVKQFLQHAAQFAPALKADATAPPRDKLSGVIAQRSVDKEHVQNLIQDIMQDLSAHGGLTVRQSVSLACTPAGGSYILDGQHRLLAFRHFTGEPRVMNATIPVVTYRCNSREEILSCFRRLNSNLPIHPLELELDWADKVRPLVQHIQRRYHVYISKSQVPQCPNVSIANIQTALHMRRDELQKDTIRTEQLIDDLNGLHRHIISLLPFQVTPSPRLEKCVSKQPEDPCFLSLGTHKDAWLDIILYRRLYDLPWEEVNLSVFGDAGLRSTRRKAIPRAVRRQVWEKDKENVGRMTGRCYVCEEPLLYDDMECAHDTPHILGGNAHVDNLFPACKSCNRDMGIQHLHAYKQRLASLRVPNHTSS